MTDEFKITKERILELIPKYFEEVLKSDYSNPIKDAVGEAIKEKDGIIKRMVNDIIAEVFTTNEFKEEITRQVIAQVLKKGLRD
jgi:hypothetical protein